MSSGGGSSHEQPKHREREHGFDEDRVVAVVRALMAVRAARVAPMNRVVMGSKLPGKHLRTGRTTGVR